MNLGRKISVTKEANLLFAHFLIAVLVLFAESLVAQLVRRLAHNLLHVSSRRRLAGSDLNATSLASVAGQTSAGELLGEVPGRGAGGVVLARVERHAVVLDVVHCTS